MRCPDAVARTHHENTLRGGLLLLPAEAELPKVQSAAPVRRVSDKALVPVPGESYDLLLTLGGTIRTDFQDVPNFGDTP